MGELTKQGEGKPDAAGFLKLKGLNRQPYTLYLINAALRIRAITKDEAESFQIQIMDILKDLILRYTRGESTSITVDAAENILNSIFYCIDAGLQNLSDTKAALMLVKSGSTRQVYEKGLTLVSDCFEETKELYIKLKKDRLKVGLEAYDLTVDEGLAVFFDKYGAVFDAHQTMASIDYPLLFDDMSVKGVFYMNNYIDTLYMEDKFCRRFSNAEIIDILMVFGRVNKIDYAKTLTNIFEIVLNAALFSVLSEEECITLPMSQMKYEVLARKLHGLNSSELEMLIDAGIKKVMHDLEIKEKKLSEYILKYKDILKTRLASAVEADSLKNLILLEDKVSLKEQKTIFIDGESLSTTAFRKLVDRLTREPDAGVKVRTIMSEVHSMEDFIDILEGSSFFGTEYSILFTQLSDHELALITRVLFIDEMRDGALNLIKEISLGIAARAEWQEMLVKFLLGIKRERLKSIETHMNDIVGM